MAYASTLETTLCTAASRAIREALSIEETIEDQQVRVYFYNRFIDLLNSKHYRWRNVVITTAENSNGACLLYLTTTAGICH